MVAKWQNTVHEIKEKKNTPSKFEESDAPESTRYPDDKITDIVRDADPLPHWEEITDKPDKARQLKKNGRPIRALTQRSPDSRGEILVRCPDPSHTDDEPSCSLNIYTGKWCCQGFRCGPRGKNGGADIFDAYACAHNLDPEKDFPKIREAVLVAYGYWKGGTKASPTWVDTNEIKKEPPTPTASVTSHPTLTGATIEKETADDEDLIESKVPKFALDKRLNGTFLGEYIKAYSQDQSPDQYHWACALLIIGLAQGRDLVLDEVNRKAYGNLNVVLIGSTAVGKSSAVNHLREMLNKHLKFNRTNPDGKGVRQLLNIQSGEALIDALDVRPIDPSTGKESLPIRIKAIHLPAELSEITTLTKRPGNSIQSALVNASDLLDPLETNARGSKASAEGYFWSGLTTTQPRVLKRSLHQEDINTGVANRFLPIFGTPKPWNPFDEVRIDTTLIERLLDDLIAWSPPKLTLWSPAAKEIFKEFAYGTYYPKFKEQRLMTTLLDRAPFMLKKIALLLSANAHHSQIEVSDVEIALSWWPTLLYMWTRAVDDIAISENSEHTNKIVEFIGRYKSKNAGKLPTRRDIAKTMPKEYEYEKTLRAINVLVELEILIRHIPRPGQKGQPADRFSVNE